MHGSGLQVFTRYATEHRHSGLGRYTPAAVPVGAAALDQQRRQRALDRSWARHPEGSVRLASISVSRFEQTAARPFQPIGTRFTGA
ncbi:hypothetical protein [Rhodococcus sp. OK302]|uniref:hypothetical protein n=1 Tax=Rhodococcus sp. OK302 TaxID=1882769 RepID=UPI000B946210|nr:hypothetical protein [Rhodococcus sp. OK302]